MSEIQRLILNLTRERQTYLARISQIEAAEPNVDGKPPTAAYERGVAFGLNMALNRIEAASEEER